MLMSILHRRYIGYINGNVYNISVISKVISILHHRYIGYIDGNIYIIPSIYRLY
jgi:hypothetical protein